MNEEKMSSDEVPGKFTEWLLYMGCPADRVPSQDKISEICRGQYHMVWQSLMEKVEARDVVREKRMQVFCDDIRRCRKNKVYTQQDSPTIVPEQLSLWKQQSDRKQQVEDAKARVTLARRDLDQLMDKVSTKIAQREVARTRVADLSRRVWLLMQVADDLAAKKTSLQETRAIADSLCAHDDDADVQAKLDKCLAAFRRKTTAQVSVSSNASGTSNDNELEEEVLQLVKSRGGDLCGALYQRRGVLVQALAKYGEAPKTCNNKVSAESVLARTAALHCALMLEAIKNKTHLKQTRKKLLATITDLNNYLSGEACELLVARCEQTRTSARVTSLRALLDEAATHTGVFYTTNSDTPTTHGKSIHAIDKDIVSKKEELKRLTTSMATTERKIQSARDCLRLVFGAFRTDAPRTQPLHYRGIQLDLPSEPVPSVREWYTRRRDSHRRRVDLSMELEVSDDSITDLIDYTNLRYVDELRIYLKKFNLEKNRQLVLESGEKLWIFETVQSSVHRLYSAWCSNDVTCRLLCPSHGVATSASRIADVLRTRAELEETLRSISPHRNVQIIDITTQKEEEQKITDRTKKRLRENLLDLQKTNKIFVLAEENLKLWSKNDIRKYISHLRKHDGMTYRDYEVYYMENCLLACPRK